MKGIYNWYGDEYENAPYKMIQRKDFHIGQCYEKTTAKTLICIKCGADKFMVGQGSYFTALKCFNCKWEVCIHEG